MKDGKKADQLKTTLELKKGPGKGQPGSKLRH